jgi:hypothetical protein
MEEDVDPPVRCAKKKPRRSQEGMSISKQRQYSSKHFMCNVLTTQEERSYKKMMMALPPLWQVQISVGRVYGWNLDTCRLILVLVSKINSSK